MRQIKLRAAPWYQPLPIAVSPQLMLPDQIRSCQIRACKASPHGGRPPHQVHVVLTLQQLHDHSRHHTHPLTPLHATASLTAHSHVWNEWLCRGSRVVKSAGQQQVQELGGHAEASGSHIRSSAFPVSTSTVRLPGDPHPSSQHGGQTTTQPQSRGDV